MIQPYITKKTDQEYTGVFVFVDFRHGSFIAQNSVNIFQQLTE
jgi:hypothetical protein